MSKDPILFGGRQANLYVYVGNDPINAVDSNGLLGDYIGYTFSIGSTLAPLLGIFGLTVPSTAGFSLGIFKDVNFSSGDATLGFYFTKNWTVDAPTAPIICNAGTEAGLLKSVDAFKGKSSGGVVDLGPFAANASWSPGSKLPSTVGGNLAAGYGAFMGWSNSDTSVWGVSGGLSGVSTVR